MNLFIHRLSTCCMQGTRWSCGHLVGAVWGQMSWKPLPTSWEDCLLSNSYTEYINYECVHRKCGNKYQGAKSQKYNIVKSAVHLHTQSWILPIVNNCEGSEILPCLHATSWPAMISWISAGVTIFLRQK